MQVLQILGLIILGIRETRNITKYMCKTSY